MNNPFRYQKFWGWPWPKAKHTHKHICPRTLPAYEVPVPHDFGGAGLRLDVRFPAMRCARNKAKDILGVWLIEP